jgi:ABC-type branched-subunit amino acid transport system substrate-binding protein
MKHALFLRRALSAALTFLVLTSPRTLSAEVNAPDPARIGAIVPLTGVFARIGAIVRGGIEHAALPRGALAFEDEGCEPAMAVTAYKRFLADGVRFFIGPCCGSPQEALAPLLAGNHALAMLVSSASRDLFASSHGRMYSAQFAIEDESEFAADAMYQRGMRNVALLFGENAFSRSHEKAFRERFKGTVLGSFTYGDGDLQGLRAVLLKLRALKPDALYVPDVSPFLLGLAREMKNLGLSGTQLVSIYAVQNDEVLKANVGALEGLLYTYPDIGADDALEYFPRRGAEILAEAVRVCRGDDSCVGARLKQLYHFDGFGVLETPLKLRHFSNGAWQKE